MEDNKKGCVYFFKHVGLNPVKIGYTENESPIKRFEQFKTYAPFGAELIGFIRTNNSKALETELHQKYARDRIKGEWFEISRDEAEKCISFHSNLLDIEEMNSFQVFWAKSFSKKNVTENLTLSFLNLFSLEKIDHCNVVVLNQTELSNLLNCEKKEVSLFMQSNNIIQKNYKVNGFTKNGYKLYKKRFSGSEKCKKD